jgi:glycosyltransferase involved in cell wall biosynthesis
MISWELHPFHTRGGTAYAIRRLADQLTALGIETRVLLPDWLDTQPGNDLSPLLKPVLLKMRSEFRDAPRVPQSLEFSRLALEQVEESDAVIAHSAEGAMFIILRGEKRHVEPSVFWLHSLFDPSISDLSKEQRRMFPSPSLLASAVMMADLVVTSTGVLKDAREFEWPDRLRELQTALTTAVAEERVLTVESTGCLAEVSNDSPSSTLEALNNVPSPYVFFPGRPTVDKGFGFFAAIAERLQAYNIACVAVHRPTEQAVECRNIHWLPWLNQDELLAVMRNAACTVLPSITEGFGLAAAESISQGVATLYQEVGGHHILRGLPNALPIPLTTTERAELYGLWSELIEKYPNFWPVWCEHKKSLTPLVDKWVDSIRSVAWIQSEPPRGSGWVRSLPEYLWANRLRLYIEMEKTLYK